MNTPYKRSKLAAAEKQRQLSHGIARRGITLAWLAAAVAVASITNTWLGPLLPAAPAWLLGLAGHFQWPALGIGLLAASAATLCGRRVALVPGAIVLGGWFLHLGEAPPSETRPAPVEVLRVASLNLNFENHDLQPLEQWMAAADAPDIMVLQEFTPEHRQIIEASGDAKWALTYRHRSLHPRSDQFGIAVLSRWPIRSAQEIAPQTAEDTLKLHLMIDWKRRPLAVTAIHPMPPITAAYAAARDRSMMQEARRLAELKIPGILVGDFNDTPWSTGMRSLAPYLSRATGLTPTWPNIHGRASLLPVDHVLVTSQWSLVDHALGADIGSDHRPVTASIALKP